MLLFSSLFGLRFYFDHCRSRKSLDYEFAVNIGELRSRPKPRKWSVRRTIANEPTAAEVNRPDPSALFSFAIQIKLVNLVLMQSYSDHNPIQPKVWIDPVRFSVPQTRQATKQPTFLLARTPLDWPG